MSTSTATITTPTAKTFREASAGFLAATEKYRRVYWTREYMALPALEAKRWANDMTGLRWHRASDAGKRAVLALIAECWPEMAHLPTRTQFILAVRESALGVVR